MIRKNTDQRTELIQTRTELMRNEQVFTEYFNLKGSDLFYFTYIQNETEFGFWTIDVLYTKK